VNPHHRHPASLVALVRSAIQHRALIRQLTRREVVGRYQGSIMGMAWSFLNPLVMLAIYTFVFSVVFRTRWGGAADATRGGFAITLFAGQVVHGLLAECINRAPALVLAQPNLVKKVVFPLEILPWTLLGSALFHAAASVAVLITAQLMLAGVLHVTVLWLPLVLLPLVVLALGLAWLLAALGVYVRDIAQTTGMATTILLFLSPVFYPASALPEAYRSWLYLNPLTPVIENARMVLIEGQPPDLSRLGVTFVVSIVVAQAGFWFFQRSRKGFADVL
jgi:lipopolysaccharide transport system permease protein